MIWKYYCGLGVFLQSGDIFLLSQRGVALKGMNLLFKKSPIGKLEWLSSRVGYRSVF